MLLFSNMNRHAFDWGRNGLLAYASYAVIVILDPSSLQPMQTLDKDHTFSVTNLKWCKAWNYKKQGNCPEMMLASAGKSSVSYFNLHAISWHGRKKSKLKFFYFLKRYQWANINLEYQIWWYKSIISRWIETNRTNGMAWRGT